MFLNKMKKWLLAAALLQVIGILLVLINESLGKNLAAALFVLVFLLSLLVFIKIGYLVIAELKKK